LTSKLGYDSTGGLFTQEDPIGLAGGMNAYGFAAGDRINFSDPMGHSPCCIELAGVQEGIKQGVDEALKASKSVVMDGVNYGPPNTGFAPDFGGGSGMVKGWQRQLRTPKAQR
jgi:hypothetical protein